MGCSNTKSFAAGTGMESAMNALNAFDTSEVVEEGQKLISQGHEKISNMIDEGQEKISNMIDEGEKIINQANEALGE